MGLRERERKTGSVSQWSPLKKEGRRERDAPNNFTLNVGEKLRERDTQRGRKFKNFQSFLSLPKSRGVGPDARALENTNASLARRYKTSARTVESPKLWPSLRGRALCDSNRERGKKNTSEFLNASSGEKRENSRNRSKREEKLWKTLRLRACLVQTPRVSFSSFERERERERERDVPFVPRSRAEP